MLTGRTRITWSSQKVGMAPRGPSTDLERTMAIPTRLLSDLADEELLVACERLGIYWSLDPGSLIGAPPERDRVLCVVQIFEAAGDLQQADEDFINWPNEPLRAPGFNGRTPLEIMQTGIEGIILVQDYLNFILRGASGVSASGQDQ